MKLSESRPSSRKSGQAKCVVWDLDNTVWEGVLLEGDVLQLRDGVSDIIRTLDERGILQSIASHNDHEDALATLRRFELAHYFLVPQISWRPKPELIETIAGHLDIAPDAIAFVDDDPFERDQVSAALPDVLCIDAADLPFLLDRPEMIPRFTTEESRQRRLMYQAEIERQKAESVAPAREFALSLDMVLTISDAVEDDLERIEELTVRTHQLNSTGYTYSRSEFDEFRCSPDHKLLIAGLDDRYGTYGKIGMALIDCRDDMWLVKLLLMSCRVITRGVGTILLSHILMAAGRAGARVQAEFVRQNRNRMMYLTFKLAGFKEISRRGNVALLEHDLKSVDPFPDHVEVKVLC